MPNQCCYLEFHDEGQNIHLFWTGDVEGNVFRSSKGRIGAKARIHEQTFPDQAGAVKAYGTAYAEKTRRGYKDKTQQRPSAAAQAPSAFAYSLTWKAESSVITNEMLEKVRDRLVAFTEAAGRGRWSFDSVPGARRLTFVFTDAVTSEVLRFGHAPDAELDAMNDVDRQVHVERGINGWLSPSGHSVDGGRLATNGLWVDVAVKAMFGFLRAEGAGVVVYDDLVSTPHESYVTLPDAAHRAKFVWTPEWETLQPILDNFDLLDEQHRSANRVRDMFKKRERVLSW